MIGRAVALGVAVLLLVVTGTWHGAPALILGLGLIACGVLIEAHGRDEGQP